MDVSNFVPQFYKMDPATDDLMAEGRQLFNGMIVLVADKMMRQDLREIEGKDDAEISPYALDRAEQYNRWCTVSGLTTQRRDHMEDLVRFIGVYEDGTKTKFTIASSHAWLYKKDSLPKDVFSEHPAAVSREMIEHVALRSGLDGATADILLRRGWRFVDELGGIPMWQHPIWKLKDSQNG